MGYPRNLVTVLCEQTGAGMIDVKRALDISVAEFPTEDMVKIAKRLLRYKGCAVAHKHTSNDFCFICWRRG